MHTPYYVYQTLFTPDITPNLLGLNVYSTKKQGESLDRMVQCVEDSR
jgi:hypothetical protein